MSGPHGHEQDAWQPQKAFGGGGRCHQQGAGQSADTAGTVIARQRGMSSGLGTQPEKSRGTGGWVGLGTAHLQLNHKAGCLDTHPPLGSNLSCPPLWARTSELEPGFGQGCSLQKLCHTLPLTGAQDRAGTDVSTGEA